MVEYEGRQSSFSGKMYGFYTQEKRVALENFGHPISESFLVWHRARRYDAVEQMLKQRGGKHQQDTQPTLVVACRYWYELTDGFWGQFVLTPIPHQSASELLPRDHRYLQTMQNFAGMIDYLMTWRWDDKREGMITSSGRTKACTVFSVEALPLCVGDDGARESVGVYVAGAQVFAAEQAAFDYIKMLARRDLQYRGFRDDRVRCFGYKQDAGFLLHQRVRSCRDAEELEMLR